MTMLPSASASRFGEEQRSLREFDHDTRTMFGFLSERSAVSIDGVGAHHVFHFDAGDGAYWVLDLESGGRVVDVICETPFHRGEIANEIHG